MSPNRPNSSTARFWNNTADQSLDISSRPLHNVMQPSSSIARQDEDTLELLRFKRTPFSPVRRLAQRRPSTLSSCSRSTSSKSSTSSFADSKAKLYEPNLTSVYVNNVGVQEIAFASSSSTDNDDVDQPDSDVCDSR